MGDDDGGGTGRTELRSQLRDEGRPRGGVQGGERLVQEQDLRVSREGASQANPLGFAPGERPGMPVREVADVEASQPGGGRALGVSA